MIKNIILDMGNVLLTYDPEVSLDKYCQTNEEKKIIRKALFQSETWLDGDRGLVKNEELFDIVKLNVDKKYWDTLKQCCDNWYICMQPILGAKVFCEYLKKKGYKLYILSNANDKFYEYFERLLPFTFFDGIVVSSDIKIIKPNLEIYQYLLDKYHLIPEECLFIDDSISNVNAAKSLHINAYQFKNNYQEIKAKYDL